MIKKYLPDWIRWPIIFLILGLGLSLTVIAIKTDEYSKKAINNISKIKTFLF